MGDEEYLEYIVPADTNLTSEAGDIEVQLTFVKADVNEQGQGVQYVRKTNPATITITPIAAWADIIPDEALTAVDQKLIKIDADIRAISEISEVISQTKADNIEVGNIDETEDKYLYLKANGNKIGDPIKLSDLGDDIADNTPEGIVSVVTI